MTRSMKETFSERFKALREKRGLTQEQMAKRLEISRQAIVNYEQGTRIPDIDILARIVTTCECSAYYLLGLQNEMSDRYAHMTDSIQLSEDALFFIDLYGDHIEMINNMLINEDFWDCAFCLSQIATGNALVDQYEYRNPNDYLDFLKYQAHKHIDAMIDSFSEQGRENVDKEKIRRVAQDWSKKEHRYLRMGAKLKKKKDERGESK